MILVAESLILANVNVVRLDKHNQADQALALHGIRMLILMWAVAYRAVQRFPSSDRFTLPLCHIVMPQIELPIRALPK
jgi:hypothetical protein